jgi:hypothetical protein
VPADRISVDARYRDIPVDGMSIGIEWRISSPGYPDIHFEYPNAPAE